eukprot:CAMPEP_0194171926 /NCGR_PEP_ID=MMETSP0154-20130528/6490_1 /TAXON_ID=1049557 /ORGANISM="Thalassiothrix antarctica, Strain L6-D1" /LENGTH=181 /DNA_ID=CAMNT_0038884449 /DNA_START=22 /DNA_END=567 /DNA_ORIENTATION=-
MSSLQLRADNLHKSKKENFESSFASGLNLSEFLTEKGESSSSVPASAILFREKRKQAAENIRNDFEDARFEAIAKQRAHRLKESLLESIRQNKSLTSKPLRAPAPWEDTGEDLFLHASSTSERRDKNMFQMAISMHGNDINGAKRENSLTKLNIKNKKRSQKCLKVKNRKVVKISKRRKHR